MNQQRITQQTPQWSIQSGASARAMKSASHARLTNNQQQLEIEYKTMKQENAKLKEVITTLKQEIDLYSRVMSRNSPQVGPTTATIPLQMETLLVNPKRRKTMCLGSSIKP
ncbi:hypothetical protein KDRO_F03030 [Kluyveromyces lactis]|nr:hypothetical protein KDRO_F03030 [Kluyveromyces lactis]